MANVKAFDLRMCICVLVIVCVRVNECVGPKFIHIFAMMIVNNCRFTSNWILPRAHEWNVSPNDWNCDNEWGPAINFFHLQFGRCKHNAIYIFIILWQIEMGKLRIPRIPMEGLHAIYEMKCGKWQETKCAMKFVWHECWWTKWERENRWNFQLIIVDIDCELKLFASPIRSSHFEFASTNLTIIRGAQMHAVKEKKKMKMKEKKNSNRNNNCNCNWNLSHIVESASSLFSKLSPTLPSFATFLCLSHVSSFPLVLGKALSFLLPLAFPSCSKIIIKPLNFSIATDNYLRKFVYQLKWTANGASSNLSKSDYSCITYF